LEVVEVIGESASHISIYVLETCEIEESPPLFVKSTPLRLP